MFVGGVIVARGLCHSICAVRLTFCALFCFLIMANDKEEGSVPRCGIRKYPVRSYSGVFTELVQYEQN